MGFWGFGVVMKVIAASLWRLNHYAIRLLDAINDSVLVGGFKVAIELLHELVVMLLVGKAHVTPQLKAMQSCVMHDGCE